MLYGSLQVKPGDVVQAGTVLGHVGDTGLSYGAHLHFEVFVNGARIDPLPWLRQHAGG
jgi:murein DD-endopeptidase MepM/ murein hydrolase activator NlpD